MGGHTATSCYDSARVFKWSMETDSNLYLTLPLERILHQNRENASEIHILTL